jgi:hypothetical protein
MHEANQQRFLQIEVNIADELQSKSLNPSCRILRDPDSFVGRIDYGVISHYSR